MSDAENPKPTNIDLFNTVHAYGNTLIAEQVRAGVLDPAAVERRIVELEKTMGLVEVNLNNVPLAYRDVCEAMLAEMDVHSVLFVRWGQGGGGDVLRFRCAFILWSRFPQQLTLIARGHDAVLVRAQQQQLPAPGAGNN